MPSTIPGFSHDLVPISRWNFPSEGTNEVWAPSLRAREEWANLANHHTAWVIDMSNIVKAPAMQRKAMAEHLKRFDEYGSRYNAGSAWNAPNPFLRGLVTAVTWFSAPRFPCRLFSEPAEAERWAQQQLADKLAELG